MWAHRVGLREEDRFPITVPLLVDFVSSVAGHYAGSTISNWISALRAYHLTHGFTLDTSHDLVKQVRRGAERLTPPASKRPPRPAYTARDLILLAPHFDLNEPFDAAIWATLLSAFWGLARLGELIVPRIDAFNPRFHPTRQSAVPHQLYGSTHFNIHLPWTKTSPTGGNLILSAQHPPLSPPTAIIQHFLVNPAQTSAHLFAWGPHATPMTRSAFTRRIHQAATAAQQPQLPGHSLRIGGCTELLLRGIPLDAIRIAGRWSSDAWKVYIRRHVELLVPQLAFSSPQQAQNLVAVGAPDAQQARVQGRGL
ncbi:hypothetical protein CF319_g4566 [Tilletia indica]|nr:hypothetical protein CF319_g4566 [Tilletia indica]